MTIGHSTGLITGGDAWIKQIADQERIRELEKKVDDLRQDLTAMTASRDDWRTMVFALIDDSYRRRATDWTAGYQAGVPAEHAHMIAFEPRPATAQKPHLLVQP